MIEELIKQLPTATPLFVLVAGFVIGLFHAFEPDHVVAVATQNSKSTQKSSLSFFQQIRSGAIKSSILGALWGAGHTSSLVLVSLLIFVFSMNIPNEMFSNFEFGVGVMLVILGVFTYLNRKLVGEKHIHTHTHDDLVHTHPHTHDKVHNHGHKSYIIGCIHGLAGSGSLVVLALSTLHDLQTILSFILVFGIGSIVGMMLVSSAIGLPFSLSVYSERINKILRYLVGSISIIIGIDILYNIVISGSFFGLNITSI
ncbi:MAG: high frequency lysogenization protein HflD [Nitrosarchaeum sp.]|nr:high frequency lysogenization protein HflD [Nitrosarchaeum sp.]